MSNTLKTIIFGLIFVFLACNTPANKKENSVRQIAATDSVRLDHIKTETTNKQAPTDVCIRGQATPIIQKARYPNTTFALQPDSLTAIETVSFDNGDKLIIRNWGCEYYVLTFRFETSKFQQDTANLEFWFRTADRLMTGMISSIDSPMDIKRGLVYLGSYVDRDEKNNYKNLILREEIYFGGNEIRSFVTVDKVEKLTEMKFAVEISFATGPL